MTHHVTLSVDAMGGDDAPDSVLGGCSLALKHDNGLKLLLHGDQAKLQPMLGKFGLDAVEGDTVRLIHCPDVIAMDAKPSTALRRGRGSSLWQTLCAVRDNKARAAISGGNTGALMAIAQYTLGRAKGIDRPAIAALWPARTPSGSCVVLDMGADVRADGDNLVTYAFMGAEYARIALGLKMARVGVLNVGTEAMKGLPEVREAADTLTTIADGDDPPFEFVGFVEANAIFAGAADVVVTDGFTGNIALKSAEGAAVLIREELSMAFRSSWTGKLAGLLARGALAKVRRNIDPRKVNGGVFLGLGGIAIKSHGSADATGFASALALAARMASENFAPKLSESLEKSFKSTQSGSPDLGKSADRRLSGE